MVPYQEELLLPEKSIPVRIQRVKWLNLLLHWKSLLGEAAGRKQVPGERLHPGAVHPGISIFTDFK